MEKNKILSIGKYFDYSDYLRTWESWESYGSLWFGKNESFLFRRHFRPLHLCDPPIATTLGRLLRRVFFISAFLLD